MAESSRIWTCFLIGNGKTVERSIDRLLNSKRDFTNFSFDNCIDWYWVYSVGGVVVYEEYSHTTCGGGASCDVNTELACLDDGSGGGGGDNNVDLKCPELMNTHGESFQDINSFENQNLGLTYYDIVEQRPNNGWDFTSSQWGGPNIRYISDPLNPSIKIDLRHTLIVGAMGRTIGNSIEIIQGINGESSAYDYQDYYSNEIGYKFFEIYGDAINNEPFQFVTYLKQFLLSRMYRNEISNPDRCQEVNQG
jgi:hypothetical protein